MQSKSRISKPACLEMNESWGKDRSAVAWRKDPALAPLKVQSGEPNTTHPVTESPTLSFAISADQAFVVIQSILESSVTQS